ncbi:MAG: metallophosphoesterase [Comamonas sp.]|nr:metallophosphoesterase [Candidatus Comamonas equi]
MVFLIALMAPLLSLWLWHPLLRMQRRAFWWLFGWTTLLALAPALLIVLMRHEVLPYAVLAYLQLISGGIFACFGMGLVWAVVRDVPWLLLRATRGASSAARVVAPRWPMLVLALSLGVNAFGLLQGSRLPEVREQVVTLPRLPAKLDGLRIAALADIHATPVNNATYVQGLVERTNAARPDMVVLPGDLVDGDAPTQARNIAPLAGLQAPLGVWSAPGNHEYYSGYDAWAKVYQRLGLNYLANEARVLNVRGHKLAISGVGDPAYGRLSEQNTDPTVAEGVPPDVQAVAAQAQAGGAEVHILLGHQPKMARSYAPHGIDLQIAGHTHGGHIIGMDRWIVAPANDGFVSGLYAVGPMRLFVSNGAGLWPGFAVRLGVPSSIDILVLRRG